MPDTPPTAVSGETGPPSEEEVRAIGRILERDAEPIMERWFERATREQAHAGPYQREVVMDDLLEMVRSLAQRLQGPQSDRLEDAAGIAAAHGRQRAGIGWNVIELVRDYETLHGVVLEHVRVVVGELLTCRQAMALATLIENAIGSAVASFSQLAQERLEQTNRKLDEQVHHQQAELRHLTLQLTDAEHRQRQQIAKILHDDLQQMMMATRMKLQAAVEQASAPLSAVEEAIGLLDRMSDVSRNLTADLYPVALEQRGLPAAVEWLKEVFGERYGLTVKVDVRASAGMNVETLPLQRLLFDAVRELLFNVVKHAQTDRAWVRISTDTSAAWTIEVEDRGVGLADVPEVRASADRTSVGLGNVRYRIEQVGGTMQVHSEPGQGTRAVLTVPLEPPSEA